MHSTDFGIVLPFSIENFPAPSHDGIQEPALSSFAPFVFSAASEKSLLAYLDKLSQHLSAKPDINARGLAWTLSQRRSTHPYRITFPAGTTESLRDGIRDMLKTNSTDLIQHNASTASTPSRVLFVFHGQGAQYARMAAELLQESPQARSIMATLQGHLDRLPEPDRPSWTLSAELLAPATTSRLDDAALAQPLTTSVQILLVQLLRSAHITPQAVVGHSSGEIAAAYAAGYLSERDAMLVAYYRGFHLPTGSSTKGAMLAVATSPQDAADLCEDFAGRAAVAAVNSATSVTLSGDEDAIAEIEVVLGEEKKWFRRLRVDRAYHSHHMRACVEPYIASLEAQGVHPSTPTAGSPVWSSAVYEGEAETEVASAGYWAANTVRPVLFSQAVAKAVAGNQDDEAAVDLVLEIGAHPALKQPASQTMSEALDGRSLPYSATLQRGRDAVAAFSDALGFVWKHSRSADPLDMASFNNAMVGKECIKPTLLKGLPTYQWDHDKTYWHESRRSRLLRSRSDARHPLLGHLTPDSAPGHCLSWKGLLRLADLPWISDHSLQNQPVFPAAGMLVTAIEAGRLLVRSLRPKAEAKDVQLVQLDEFAFRRFMVFDEQDAGVETLVSLYDIQKKEGEKDAMTVTAKFRYEAVMGDTGGDLTHMADGTLSIILASPDSNITTLPQRACESSSNMLDVDEKLFYSSLADVGYNYKQDFAALSNLRRKLGRATGRIRMPVASTSSSTEGWLIPPETLDNAFQALVLSSSFPRDGRLWNVHVPVGVSRLQLDPALLSSTAPKGDGFLYADAHAAETTSGSFDVLGGDVLLYRDAFPGSHAAVRIEGLKGVPMTAASFPKDYRRLFYKQKWGGLNINEESDAGQQLEAVTDREKDLSRVVERVATFYARKIDQAIPASDPARAEGAPFVHWLRYLSYVRKQQEAGEHIYAPQDWLTDTEEDMLTASAAYADTPDVRMLHVVGRNMPRVLTGETTILEHMRQDNLLEDFYVHARGYGHISAWLARKMRSIAHRYPRMNIIEIGAGTGGATKPVMRELDGHFASYTFTDVSTSFFSEAQASLGPLAHSRPMHFKTLDVGADVIAQGFKPAAYDLAVAFLVLHIAPKLETALTNVRRLLKPGGYLLLTEITSIEHTWPTFAFGTLPGWWGGVGEGRTLSAGVDAGRWEEVLRKTGFAGIDVATPPEWKAVYGSEAFVIQAVDEKVSILRNPTVITATQPVIGDLVILGGGTAETAPLVAQLEMALRPQCSSIGRYSRLEDVRPGSRMSPFSTASPPSPSQPITVLNLLDLDEPVFKDLSAFGLDSLKAIFQDDRTVLWLTRGRRSNDPFAALALGFARVAVGEVGPGLNVQFLDFESVHESAVEESRVITETLLRLQQSVRNKNNTKTMLWSLEPEIVVDAHGRQLIPRLEEWAKANERYNSRRGLVSDRVFAHSEVDIDKSPVAVEIVTGERGQPTGCILRNFRDPHTSQDLDGNTFIELTTSHAILSAMPTVLGPRFLVLGHQVNKETGEHVKTLALTKHIASHMVVPLETGVEIDQQNVACNDADLVALAADHLIAVAVTRDAFPGQTVLVHGVDSLHLAKTIVHEAKAKAACAVFTWTSECSSSWASEAACPGLKLIEIPAGASRRDLQGLLATQEFSSFWGLAHDSNEMQKTIVESGCLPMHCTTRTAASLFSTHAVSVPSESAHLLGELLASAVASLSGDEVNLATPTITVDELTTGSEIESYLARTMLCWPASTSDNMPRLLFTQTTAVGEAIGASMLRPDRTYWLVGLSGSLGLSLVDWMVKQGARHIVITSRNPSKIDRGWIAGHKRGGVTITTLAWSVSAAPSSSSIH